MRFAEAEVRARQSGLGKRLPRREKSVALRFARVRFAPTRLALGEVRAGEDRVGKVRANQD